MTKKQQKQLLLILLVLFIIVILDPTNRQEDSKVGLRSTIGGKHKSNYMTMIIVMFSLASLLIPICFRSLFQLC